MGRPRRRYEKEMGDHIRFTLCGYHGWNRRYNWRFRLHKNQTAIKRKTPHRSQKDRLAKLCSEGGTCEDKYGVFISLSKNKTRWEDLLETQRTFKGVMGRA